MLKSASCRRNPSITAPASVTVAPCTSARLDEASSTDHAVATRRCQSAGGDRIEVDERAVLRVERHDPAIDVEPADPWCESPGRRVGHRRRRYPEISRPSTACRYLVP